MKAYTDLEQSKKLAKILPLESADMLIDCYDGTVWVRRSSYPHVSYEYCWSLSALLNQFDTMTLSGDCGEWKAEIDWYEEDEVKVLWEVKHTEGNSDNPLDACYEMIIKLHELNFFNDESKKKRN